MVDSINSALSNAMRMQSTLTSTEVGLAAIKSNNDAKQNLIDQIQQTADQNKSFLTASSSNVDSTLPRGSLVNILA